MIKNRSTSCEGSLDDVFFQDGKRNRDMELGKGNQDELEPKSSKSRHLDKFGGSGIIPMDITNMNYEAYCEAHHHLMIERYSAN